MWESPITHARRSLDDHLALVRSADTRDRLRRRIVAFVFACRRNAQLRVIVDGYKADNAALDQREEEQRSALWSRLDQIVTLAGQQDEGLRTVSNADWTAARVEKLLAARAQDEAPAPFADAEDSSLHAAAWGLSVVLHGLPERSQALRGERPAIADLRAVAADIDWLDRAREDSRSAAPSRIWAELARAAEIVGTPPRGQPVVHWLTTFPTGLYEETDLSEDPRRELPELRDIVLERMETLVAELRLRLGVRATHAAAIGRYAWGAFTFRRDELFAVASEDSRNAEKNLTADAARSLFAAGFDVLTEVSLGANRFDLVSFGDALLIEAKRYGPTKNVSERAVRQLVYDGVKQLHQYASRFRSKHLDTDNFLLVFRLGGVAVELPSEIVVGNTRLRFQVVDLAPSSDSGSNAPRVVEVRPDEILEAVKERP